jgi:hypothetical protein
LLGGAIVLASVAAAQQQAMPVIGYFNLTSPDVAGPATAAFHQGLREAGSVEGQMSLSNTAGPRVNMIVGQNWRANW